MNNKKIKSNLAKAIDQHGPRILQFVDYQIQNLDAAKDIVQEAFIAFFENHESVQPEKIESYLFAVVRNKIKDYFKTQKNAFELKESDKLDSNYIKTFESKDLVKKALSKLNERDTDLITLRDIMGHNYEEVGRLTELTIAQVKVYLFRARKKLKEEIIKLEVVYEK